MTSSEGDEHATARRRVREVEDAWNVRDLEALVLGSSVGCLWRARAEFIWGREQVRAHLARRWRRELDYRVVNELWGVDGRRLALRFVAEYRNDGGVWFRAHGDELWELDGGGLISRRLTSVNEHPIGEHERMFRWTAGVRPPGQADLAELAL